jgi:hypothetical protein
MRDRLLDLPRTVSCLPRGDYRNVRSIIGIGPRRTAASTDALSTFAFNMIVYGIATGVRGRHKASDWFTCTD